MQAALDKESRWWVRWVVGGVLCGAALVVWSEWHDERAPSVGGEPLKSVPNEVPYPPPWTIEGYCP